MIRRKIEEIETLIRPNDLRNLDVVKIFEIRNGKYSCREFMNWMTFCARKIRKRKKFREAHAVRIVLLRELFPQTRFVW
jgi:hypothetical protein